MKNAGFVQQKRLRKRTFLVIAEGLRDTNFLKHLKLLYEHTNKANTIIRNGRGGTADGLVQEAINTLGSFDNRATIVDDDKGECEMEKASNLAKNNNIKLIKNSPCIEAVLLAILGKEKNKIPAKTGRCKTMYAKEFLNSKRTEDNKDLLRMFPKKNLSAKRKK